jgi:hypothetical protein
MSFWGFAAAALCAVTYIQAEPDAALSIQTPQSGMSAEDRFRWVMLTTLYPKKSPEPNRRQQLF